MESLHSPKYLLKKQMIILFFFHTKMKLQVVEEKIKLFGNEESKLIVQNEEKK
jgi:hypothetical protein